MRLCSLTAIAAGLLIVGLASLSTAGDAKDDLAKQELKKFQGSWDLVSMEQGGQKFPEDKLKAAMLKVVIKGSNFTFKAGDKTIAEGKFSINPAKKPKQMDSEGTANGKTEKTIGIYQFTGDTLRICFGPADKERPTEFKTAEGSKHLLETLRRSK